MKITKTAVTGGTTVTGTAANAGEVVVAGAEAGAEGAVAIERTEIAKKWNLTRTENRRSRR